MIAPPAENILLATLSSPDVPKMELQENKRSTGASQWSNSWAIVEKPILPWRVHSFQNENRWSPAYEKKMDKFCNYLNKALQNLWGVQTTCSNRQLLTPLESNRICIKSASSCLILLLNYNCVLFYNLIIMKLKICYNP